MALLRRNRLSAQTVASMSQPLPRYRTDTNPTKIDKLVEDAGSLPTTSTVSRATLAGDTRRLRGIPVQARGVGGTSPNTNPVQALMLKER